jgi:ABC-2 type transport system permease protein
MRNVGIITKRELSAYFGSPLAYVVIAVFLLLLGFLFAFSVYFSRQASLQGMFANSSVILLLIAPLLTMRLLAEEQRTGTIELMLTAPVREVEVVLGKFFASVAFLVTMLALTLWYAVVLTVLGNPDFGPILGGYVGTLLFGASFLAIGLFASSLSQNQIVAAFIAFGVLLMLYLIDAAGGFLGGSAQTVLGYVSISPHLEDFTKGVIDTKDVVYYLSLIVVCLFLTTTVLQVRRWR